MLSPGVRTDSETSKEMGGVSAGIEGATSYGVPARLAPESYPGPVPGYSYVLVGTQVLPLETQAHAVLRFVDDVLRQAGASPLAGRIPVAAYGANASPPQLVWKFRNALPEVAIPVLRGRIRGLRLAFSAHVNRWGYMPAAVRASDRLGEELATFVTFLDPEQVARMDKTEPNYERVTIGHPGGDSILLLDSGEELRMCSLYRTRHGVLDLDAADDEGLASQRELRRRIAVKLRESDAAGLDLLGIQRFADDESTDIVLGELGPIAKAHLRVGDGLDPYIMSGGG